MPAATVALDVNIFPSNWKYHLSATDTHSALQGGAHGGSEGKSGLEPGVTSSPLPATAVALWSPEQSRATYVQLLQRKTHFWTRVSGHLQVLVSCANTAPWVTLAEWRPGQGPLRSPV